MKISLHEYMGFVEACTSAESEFLDDLIPRIYELESEGINMSLLLTGAMGLSSEAGELMELVKKNIFQGKPLDVFHMQRELGDVIWYWINTCRALNLDPYQVIEENVVKLKARYPDGEFNEFFSENRKPGDL